MLCTTTGKGRGLRAGSGITHSQPTNLPFLSDRRTFLSDRRTLGGLCYVRLPEKGVVVGLGQV